ncbi:MAG: hypothetical protein GF313_03040 [Caldithrix sp.]|nr:hypothetical protein [Caldithrix sp.]
MLRTLIIILLGIIAYQLIRKVLSTPAKNPNVKGRDKDKDNIQKKHGRNIEDADFEEVDDD